MNKSLLILLSIITFNVSALGSPISKLAGVVKFGSGQITLECYHIIPTTGSDFRYAFVTASYGACPGFESNAYGKAYKTLFGGAHPKTHNPDDDQCADYNVGWGGFE